MKYLLTLILALISLQYLSAQSSAVINYKETVKLDIQFDGMDDSMLEMLPQSTSMNKELLVKGNESIYQVMKGEGPNVTEMESDDGSFKIKIVQDDTEEILFKDLKEKNYLHQRGIMGKSFIVYGDLAKHKWKITNEKIKYLDFECQKAVIEDEDNFIVAWFTSQVPFQVGPKDYHGLPGAILMVNVNDGEMEIQATKVELKEIADEEFKKPKKGKKVTPEEFERIEAEKEKEMEEMYGGREVRRTRH